MQEVKTLQQSDHQCAQRQRHDAEQGGQDHAAGGKALVVAKLHRKHRGDGGRRTALQQQNDLCGHAAEAQQPVSKLLISEEDFTPSLSHTFTLQ